MGVSHKTAAAAGGRVRFAAVRWVKMRVSACRIASAEKVYTFQNRRTPTADF